MTEVIQMTEFQTSHAATATLTAGESATPAVATAPTSREASAPTGAKATPARGPALAGLREEKWNVVRLKGEGYGKLHQPSVRHGDDGTTTFARIKADIGTTKKVKAALNKVLYFGEEAIFEAPITLRINTGDEAQHTFVDVGPLDFDPLLTSIYHERITLDGTTDFVAKNNRFARHDRALVIGLKINKKYTIAFILFLCVVSVGLGVLVGVLCNNAGFGVAVTGGAAAVLGVVALVLMKLAK